MQATESTRDTPQLVRIIHYQSQPGQIPAEELEQILRQCDTLSKKSDGSIQTEIVIIKPAATPDAITSAQKETSPSSPSPSQPRRARNQRLSSASTSTSTTVCPPSLFDATPSGPERQTQTNGILTGCHVGSEFSYGEDLIMSSSPEVVTSPVMESSLPMPKEEEFYSVESMADLDLFQDCLATAGENRGRRERKHRVQKDKLIALGKSCKRKGLSIKILKEMRTKGKRKVWRLDNYWHDFARARGTRISQTMQDTFLAASFLAKHPIFTYRLKVHPSSFGHCTPFRILPLPAQQEEKSRRDVRRSKTRRTPWRQRRSASCPPCDIEHKSEDNPIKVLTHQKRERAHRALTTPIDLVKEKARLAARAEYLLNLPKPTFPRRDYGLENCVVKDWLEPTDALDGEVTPFATDYCVSKEEHSPMMLKTSTADQRQLAASTPSSTSRELTASTKGSRARRCRRQGESETQIITGGYARVADENSSCHSHRQRRGHHIQRFASPTMEQHPSLDSLNNEVLYFRKMPRSNPTPCEEVARKTATFCFQAGYRIHVATQVLVKGVENCSLYDFWRFHEKWIKPYFSSSDDDDE